MRTPRPAARGPLHYEVITFSFVAVLGMLVMPPLAAWIWGRRLVRGRNDPRLPERWLAYFGSLAKLGLLCASGLLVAADAAGLPLALLLLLVTAAGSFPARRALLDESWGLGSFLAFVLRFSLPLFLFWLVLAAAPAAVMATGPWQGPAAVTLAALLLLWSYSLGGALPALMRARPVESPALTDRFRQLLSRSSLPASMPPALLQAGPAGGIWAQILSVPDPRQPSVIIGRVLLDKLDADEAVALLAHNVAALEDLRRNGRIRRALRTLLLVAGAVGAVPWAMAAVPDFATAIRSFWLMLVLVIWSRSVIGEQRKIASRDRRAVELSGDPEALVRALVKAHEVANLPRRWNHDVNEAGLVASLAARIQNIRQSAGMVGQNLDEEVVLESREPGRFAILGPEQVWFLEGVTQADPDAAVVRQRAGSSRAFAYRSLAALNVKLGMDGLAVLTATTPDGQSLRLPLATASIERAQRALEIVEGKVPPRTITQAQLTSLAVMAWSFLVLAAAMAPAIPALVVAPLLLSRRRHSFAPFLAWSVVALGAGLLGLADLGGTSPEPLIGALAALVASGLLAVVARHLSRLAPTEIWRSYGLTIGMFGACALIGFPAGLNDAAAEGFALDSVQLAGPLFAAGMAVLLLARYRRRLWARGLALVLGLAVLAPVVVGTDAVRFCSQRTLFPSKGPLLGAAKQLPSWPALPPARRILEVPAGLEEVGVSADGQRVFGADPSDHGRDGERRFQIWDGEEQVEELAAVKLAFIDDRRLLAVRRDGGELFVEQPGRDGWRADLPELSSIELYADHDRFRVIGRQRDHWTLVEGAIGGSEVRSKHSDGLDRTDLGYRSAWIPSGDNDTSLSVMLDYQVSRGNALALLWHLHPRPRTSLRLDSPGLPPRTLVRTWAQVSCPQLPSGSVSFVCVASERERSWLWWVSAGNEKIESSFALPGRSQKILRSDDALAVQVEGGIVVLDGRGIRVVGTPEASGSLVAISAHAFALLEDGEDGGALTIYPR